MITKEETFNDLVVGADSEMQFTIDTESSVIFDILRNKMYSDKIGAICREVPSNSRDANREAGVDKPAVVEIISPNQALSMGHLSISFKDYGLGIPPNKMSDIYLKYGASDKRTTNNLTGGFGLGAKTPFAYNDTFTVITVCDYEGERRKYTYTAMLDTSGKGKMVLFGNEITDEETGTNIIVPIKNTSDRYDFERSVLKYTSTWGDEIEYKNFYYEPDEKKEVISDDLFTVYELQHKYSNSDMEMLIDGIPYPLDTYTLGIPNDYRRSSLKLILKFSTGELTISANRESVQYDEDTIKTIQDRYEEVQSILDNLVYNHIKDAETYLESCTRYYFYTRAIKKLEGIPAYPKLLGVHANLRGLKLKETKWEGRDLTDRFRFLYHSVIRVTLEDGKNKYTAARDFFFNNTNPLVVYGDTRKNANRNVNIWNEGHSEFYIIKPDKKDDPKAINEFMDFIFTFDLDFKSYTEYKIAKSKTVRGKSTKLDYVKLNVRETDSKSVVIHMNRKTYLQEEDGYDFSNTLYKRVESLTNGFYSDKYKLTFLEKRGYEVIIIRNQDYQNWFSKTKARCFTEVYDTEYAKYEKEVIESKLKIYKNYKLDKIINKYIPRRFRETIDELLPVYAQGLYVKEWEMSFNEEEIVKDKLKFNFDGFEKKIKTIFEEEYSMLRFIRHKFVANDAEIETVKNYIKTMKQCK